MKIKGAIFDMDGTLLNSMDYWSTAPLEYLDSIGAKYGEDSSKIFLEDGMKRWVDYQNENYGTSLSFEEANAGIYSIMDEKYKTVVKVKDGVFEMLDKLKAHGVKMCLATATDRSSVEKILEKLGLTKYFSKIFTSSEVGKGKREPLIYELALEYLGTPKDETYIFEDALYAITTAHNNGFKVVGIYDKNAYAPKETIIALCDYYLDENDKYEFEIE